MNSYADGILKPDGIKYENIKKNSLTGVSEINTHP